MGGVRRGGQWQRTEEWIELGFTVHRFQFYSDDNRTQRFKSLRLDGTHLPTLLRQFPAGIRLNEIII